MDKPDYDRLAKQVKLMAHPERLHILDALRAAPQCVCHLEALLKRPQPYVSQQVRILSRAGVLESERYGHNIYYHVSDPDLLAWLEVVLGPVAEGKEALGRHQPLEECSCPTCAAAASQVVTPLILAA